MLHFLHPDVYFTFLFSLTSVYLLNRNMLLPREKSTFVHI